MHALGRVVSTLPVLCSHLAQILTYEVNEYRVLLAWKRFALVANIAVLDGNGGTPLHEACASSSADIAECLIEFKVNPSIKSTSISLRAYVFSLLNRALQIMMGKPLYNWHEIKGNRKW